ncbi:dihydroanticapsin dehydrogenase [freshwater sediment metagenome]|jgi:NAD(P)-dependent dehydrogenase (short-subunit alcohol dehydrogenase family)|uniref:Dihydroanticapsin dehydrogenase n=1 Tax=freshwater sediment metagenome TaxID=556182 RepID=A0AA48REM7_9ZZZZ
MTGRVFGKTIIVTGGAGGLGHAISRLLAAEGAAVGVIDVDGEGAEGVAQSLTRDGARSIGLSADVSDWRGISSAARQIEKKLGDIDGLVNNAGLAALGSVHDADEESWRRIMNVNVCGVVLASKAVLPGMMERRRGVILNIASIAGLVGIQNMAAYCASKGAVLSLTRQMAVDYAPYKIRVNAISPGTIGSTEMGQRLLSGDASPEARSRRLARYPMGRYATADEIAQAALFMLSDEAEFATGSNLTLDGGLTAV